MTHDPTTSTNSVHVWFHCHECGSAPIIGPRWTCESCPAGPDKDLCDGCYQRFLAGQVRHPAEGSAASVSQVSEHVFTSSEGQPADRFKAWLTPNHPALVAPRVADGFVVRPEFRAGMESFIGAYAFVVDTEGPGGVLVLTALHIMDELIKKNGVDVTLENTNYSGRELPALVTKVQLYDVFATTWILADLGRPVGPMRVLPEARLGQEEPNSNRDIAAFEVHDPAALTSGQLAPGRLAAQPPEVGEAVWLAAKPDDDPSRRTLKAVVVECSETALVFRYQDPSLRARYSSGAPILNQAGEVVGINVGGGWLDGQKIGHANHVGNIRRHLG